MARLITGGSGLVGAELAHILVRRGEKVVVFAWPGAGGSATSRPDQVRAGRPRRFIRGIQRVRDNGITHIYHMGAMLTGESELNPWGSFHTNVIGTYNVLEAARLFGVKGLMFTSSIGTFDGSLVPELSDTVLQRPRDFYGVGKLYCEGLGRMYRRKFGLNFRGLRYPSVVGPGVLTPGHWDAPMIEAAVAGKPSSARWLRTRGGPMLYYKDAAKAAVDLLEAPDDRIRMINYNVGGIRRVTPAR